MIKDTQRGNDLPREEGRPQTEVITTSPIGYGRGDRLLSSFLIWWGCRNVNFRGKNPQTNRNPVLGHAGTGGGYLGTWSHVLKALLLWNFQFTCVILFYLLFMQTSILSITLDSRPHWGRRGLLSPTIHMHFCFTAKTSYYCSCS